MRSLRGIRDALNRRLSHPHGARVYYSPGLREEPPTPREVEELEEELDRNGMREIEER